MSMVASSGALAAADRVGVVGASGTAHTVFALVRGASGRVTLPDLIATPSTRVASLMGDPLPWHASRDDLVIDLPPRQSDVEPVVVSLRSVSAAQVSASRPGVETTADGWGVGLRLVKGISVPARDILRASLLAIPAAFVLGAIGLTILSDRLDAEGLTTWIDAILPVGSAGTTTELLGAIAGAAITLTALVFSVTMLVLQLSANQFSPRVLRTFLQDTTAQITLGVLVGTFVYALLGLRALDEPRDDQSSLTAAVAVLLALASVGMFVTYINHISHKIRSTAVMKAINDETLQAIECLRPGDDVDVPVLAGPATMTVDAPRRGFVVSVDIDELVRVGHGHDAMIVVEPKMGDFVTTGSRLATVYSADIDSKRVLRSIVIATDRTTTQDPAFGFRQLVDIIEKAMSPAINDTTTAVQAVGHLRELLRVLAPVPLPDGLYADADGKVRLMLSAASWDDFVGLAVDEVLAVAGDAPRVRHAVEQMLLEVLEVARPERQADLRRRLRALHEPSGDGPARSPRNRAGVAAPR
jgi:uncharacterized membrane protein